MATTDDILAGYSDESIELELRLVDGDAGPFMLISGGDQRCAFDPSCLLR